LRQDFAATPPTDLAPGQREIHILVIGEAARYSSFQLNGYARQTTPLLATNSDLLSFHKVSAAGTCTLYSVPLMLTVAKAPTLDQALTMPSCLQVFRKAGYKTYWLSTQRKHGRFDTTVSAFAGDADEAGAARNKYGFSHANCNNPSVRAGNVNCNTSDYTNDGCRVSLVFVEEKNRL
jgi:glucan phosphoethanolaminetransferase (alkaline phosphatase superfamily)